MEFGSEHLTRRLGRSTVWEKGFISVCGDVYPLAKRQDFSRVGFYIRKRSHCESSVKIVSVSRNIFFLYSLFYFNEKISTVALHC